MIIVTGGAGFIGSQLIKTLNKRGRSDILVVDDLKNGHKFSNLVECNIVDYIDKEDFLSMLTEEPEVFSVVEAIFHQGACSVTTEWDGDYMMRNNYGYSKVLLHFALDNEIPFIYASSAAVYGGSNSFSISPENEKPLNVYGYSKLLFDRYVSKLRPAIESQVVGLRYFNVYGPGENHKGTMASVAYHFNNQLKENGQLKLFGAFDNYAAGEQRRDFVYVQDVIDVNLWFLDNPEHSGVFNVGTGQAQTFNEVANAVIDFHGKGEITYIDFPDHLKGAYQSFTEADLTDLKEIGYEQPFHSVQSGVRAYLDVLEK